MKTIVCAIRGGEASRRTQERAIQLAKANNGRLIYFYAVNLDSLDHLSAGEAPAARIELTWLGNVLLQMAQRRATQAGVKAETFIGYGPVREAITHFLGREKADLLLIGDSRRENKQAVFPDGGIDQFAHSVAEQNGVKVEVVRER
jgi:nucleotide-binding universal stress UspA family protein